jgi:protein transport protein SEC61 subunit beta
MAARNAGRSLASQKGPNRPNGAKPTGGKPRPSGAMQKAAGAAQNGRQAAMGNSAGILRFYTDDAPGLKIGPTTVLVMSLLFIAFVVLLHIWGKFRR